MHGTCINMADMEYTDKDDAMQQLGSLYQVLLVQSQNLEQIETSNTHSTLLLQMNYASLAGNMTKMWVEGVLATNI